MIETKVIASTIGALLVSTVIAWLNTLEGDPHLLGPLPVWAQTLLLIVIPAVVTFLSGYQAKHTPRSELPRS